MSDESCLDKVTGRQRLLSEQCSIVLCVELDAGGVITEVRCPSGPGRLFMRMKQAGEKPTYIQPENWLEFSCYDCRREMARHGRHVSRVLHRYNFAGELMETVVAE